MRIIYFVSFTVMEHRVKKDRICVAIVIFCSKFGNMTYVTFSHAVGSGVKAQIYSSIIIRTTRSVYFLRILFKYRQEEKHIV